MDDIKVISDGKARRIASEWHGGQTTALLSFSTTGMIDDRVTDEVQTEIDLLQASERPDCTEAERVQYLSELADLQHYLWDAGHRTPVDGWSRVWE